MESSLKRSAAVVIGAGIIYYLIYSNLVGIAAAIGTPSWFVPFMQEHKVLGLILLSLVTTVPAVAISAALIGYVLARLLTRKYFLHGFLTVCVMVLLSSLVFDYGPGFWGDLGMSIWPPHIMYIPMYFALWFFLPLATVYFGGRKERGNE